MVLKPINQLECVRSVLSLKKCTDLWRYSGKIARPIFIQRVRPILHLWNIFILVKKHRKESLRQFPRKNAKVADFSKQEHNVQHSLFGIDENIHLDD